MSAIFFVLVLNQGHCNEDNPKLVDDVKKQNTKKKTMAKQATETSKKVTVQMTYKLQVT